MKFSDLKLNSKTISALDSMNFIQPTEVQEKTLSLILKGEDVMVRSQTGTGKTAAFGIGLVEQITASKNKKGLVIAPTRELALQITKELRAIGINHQIRVYAIYGGEEIARQLSLLRKGFEIIVATPGRLLDHFERRTINLSMFNIVVLDEADRMLDMGFRDDMEKIMKNVNPTRQTMLFSATLTRDIINLARNYLKSPIMIEVGDLMKAVGIEEETIKTTRKEKFAKLKEILKQEPGARILIFVATQRSTEYVGKKLYQNNISSNYLHGGMRQSKREKIVRDFSEGRFKVLVATDVAARGLHVDNITRVINYDEARDKDTHLHRIGRTGRMGKKGKATTFVETDSPGFYKPQSSSMDRRFAQRKSYRPRRPVRFTSYR
ncbi:MAG: DEAD/DEAH box helicase [Candidatus Micrarchaeota archaeon]